MNKIKRLKGKKYKMGILPDFPFWKLVPSHVIPETKAFTDMSNLISNLKITHMKQATTLNTRDKIDVIFRPYSNNFRVKILA